MQQEASRAGSTCGRRHWTPPTSVSNIILCLVFHAFMLHTYLPTRFSTLHIVCHDEERERTLYVAHQLLIDAVRGDLKIEKAIWRQVWNVWSSLARESLSPFGSANGVAKHHAAAVGTVITSLERRLTGCRTFPKQHLCLRPWLSSREGVCSGCLYHIHFDHSVAHHILFIK